MTNSEKYLKDELSVVALWTNYDNFCTINRCAYNENTFREFMENKAKIELTDDERAILRHLKDFYYIYRTTSGTLEATNKEHTWIAYELYFDDDVFQFIKPRRRILN